MTNGSDLEAVSRELAKHFDLNAPRSEGIKEIKGNIENVKNQMEDVKEDLKHVRQEIDNRSEVVSKDLFDAAHRLNALFEKIDSLEQFINVVKKSVNDVNDRVDEAENLIASPINRVLDTLKLSTNKVIDGSDLRLAPMKPLEIYRTENYFPPALGEEG